MRPGDLLELAAGVVLIVAIYLATSLAWPAVLTAAVVLAYLAQRSNHGPWLAHLQTLRLAPGDVLVARIPSALPHTEFEGAQARLKREFPGVRVVVVPDSMDLAKIDTQALQ